MKNLFQSVMCAFFIIGFLAAENYEEPVLHTFPENIISEQDYLDRDAPTGDEIINPAEFGRVKGVFLAWAGWAFDTITAIAREVAEEDLVYLFVRNSYYQGVAYSYLSMNDVNMENVIFILDSDISNTSIWIRDYFPYYIYEDGIQAIFDHPAGGQCELAQTVADEFDFTMYYLDLMHQGGNHISDGNGMGFCSSNIFDHNSSSSEAEIRSAFQDFFGFDSLIVVDRMEGDGTGHIDMFCKLLNDTLFVVGEYGTPDDSYPGDYELLNGVAEYLDSLQNLAGRGFRVERLPMPPFTYDGPAGTINYTYTNSLIINKKVLVPIYGFESDAEALQIYADLMPDHEIIGIDCAFIIQYWGAIHCITNAHYSENPLIVLHNPLYTVSCNSFPQIIFRLNPKFDNAEASVFLKMESDDEFTEIPAALNSGIWSGDLPEIMENFQYYITADSFSGEVTFMTNLPENAPEEVFNVQLSPVRADDDNIAGKIHLSNFPNPFRTETKISFSLPNHSEKTELTIYNLKGQKVRTFPDLQIDKSANQQIVWNGTDENNRPVSSGIYFYQIQTGQNIQTSKCLLLK